jgi:ERCC4-type nuclease
VFIRMSPSRAERLLKRSRTITPMLLLSKSVKPRSRRKRVKSFAIICILQQSDNLTFSKTKRKWRAIVSSSRHSKFCRAVHLIPSNDALTSSSIVHTSLAVLQNRQKHTQQRIRGLGQLNTSKATQDRTELLASPDKKKSSPGKANDPMLLKQNQHLDTISQTLGELGSIGHSLSSAILQHNSTIDSLDTKSDNVLEKSKQVTRRADRLIQKKSWSPAKPTYFGSVSIRHLESGKYLSVVNQDLYLVPKFHPETCVFALWKRQGEIFGLKNKYSSRWVGQSLLGSIACSAYSFGRREEWEADTDWSRSRLLCSSAGWGAGGYLQVRPKDNALILGGSGLDDRNKAAVFVISSQDSEEHGE